MAKKARRRAEEEEEEAFEFPLFDEPGFLAHEYEQYYATLLAFALGVVIGLASYIVGTLRVPVAVPFAVGLAGTAGGAWLIQKLRPLSAEYTRGDWASLIVLIFFGFLGIWFLLADVLGRSAAF